MEKMKLKCLSNNPFPSLQTWDAAQVHTIPLYINNTLNLKALLNYKKNFPLTKVSDILAINYSASSPLIFWWFHGAIH